MIKILKILGVVVFMIVGFLVGDFIFDNFIDPLNIGPSPVMAVVTVVIIMAISSVAGVVVLRAEDLL
jgi:hypothetical protein